MTNFPDPASWTRNVGLFLRHPHRQRGRRAHLRVHRLLRHLRPLRGLQPRRYPLCHIFHQGNGKDQSRRCYKTFFVANLNFPEIKK